MSPSLNVLCISSKKPHYTKIPIYVRTTFNYCTQFLQNSQSTLIMNSRSTGIHVIYWWPALMGVCLARQPAIVFCYLCLNCLILDLENKLSLSIVYTLNTIAALLAVGLAPYLLHTNSYGTKHCNRTRFR